MASLTVMASFKAVWVAPSSCWYPASLFLAPLSAPTHQTWQAPSWGSWRRTVGVFYSELLHTASSSLLPAMDGSDIFWVFSSPFFFWPPPHLFQAGVAIRQQPGAKQHRPGGPYSIAVVLRLIKMQIRHHFVPYREIFRPYSWYTWNIRVTFQVHSRYSSCIFWILGRSNRKLFGSHSASILAAFVQHSRHLPTGLQALFGQQSNCSRMAFEVHSEHYDSILNIPTVFQTTFELHSRDTLGMCNNHSIRVRSEFLVFERHS